MADKAGFQPIELDLLKMKRIFAAAAMATILSACGTDNASGEAEEQAEVAKALKEQQVQVAQSMEDRWNHRAKSAETAEGDANEGTIRSN